MKIERMSLMIEGVPCTVMYNGVIKNYAVRSNSQGKKYIQFNGHTFYEDDLPFGEEVDI